MTVAVGGTTVGLATCYDLRFPALFSANVAVGARLSIVCAPWGAGPGKAEHWDLLVRARAVGTTTFVIAVGHGDPGPDGRASTGAAPTGIGRTAVVSPFGEILHQLGGEEGLLVVDVDPGALDAARAKLPVLAHRRLGLE